MPRRLGAFVLALVALVAFGAAAASVPGEGVSVPTLGEFNELEARVTALEERPVPTVTVTPTPSPSATPTPATFSSYLQKIPGLVHYWPLDAAHSAQDVVGGAHGTVNGTVAFGSAGAVFDGSGGDYIDMGDRDSFSLVGQPPVAPGRHEMTILVGQSVSDWASSANTGNGYVHWMGKGAPGNHEYVFRYYPSTDSSRPKRTSAYHYTPTDVLNNSHQGAGSYFQDDDPANAERVIAVRLDDYTTSGVSGAGSAYPGAVWLSKNGIQRDADGFWNGGSYNIDPGNTTAPFRVGTRDLASWEKGKVRRVAIFNRKLTDAEIRGIYDNWGLPDSASSGPTPTNVNP